MMNLSQYLNKLIREFLTIIFINVRFHEIFFYIMRNFIFLKYKENKNNKFFLLISKTSMDVCKFYFHSKSKK